MRRLDNKVAIVTGAGGGIGSATAVLMAACGAKVVLADIHLQSAERVAAAVERAGGSALPLFLDLASEHSIIAMVQSALHGFGKIDVLHNNAADLSPELSNRDRDVEGMEADVMQGNLGQAAYAASKAAIIQLTRSIATSHGRRGIRCNAVSPGLVMTPAARDNLPPRLHKIVAGETLTPYLGIPEDIAHAVAFLASDDARYVTGHNLVVDGGTVAHVPGFAEFSEMLGAH